ncbi:protein of unassigned function [Methylobacterium oryzae CBMB20]|uniref:Protein of unassigned function n=1 Tax=Methylobacterium oryzae CBMB20 TaxID=693986 RepID=A0A089NZZ5_9HYPH|nr:protein of unassigned function [Methylobacterium oryzae CBMB20]
MRLGEKLPLSARSGPDHAAKPIARARCRVCASAETLAHSLHRRSVGKALRMTAVPAFKPV